MEQLEKDIKTLFTSTNEGKNFKEYYSTPNFFDVIDMFRYEDANTNFLASFLNSQNNFFQLGNKPILTFIDLLIEKGKGKLKEDFSNIKNLAEIDVDISLRSNLIDSKRHPDMIITINRNEKSNNKYFILLEAKLSSSETSENQCLEYYEKAKEKYEKEYHNMAYVYLSLLNNPSISDNDHYIKITYQDLIDKLYEPFLNELETKNKKLKEILDDYLKSFSHLVKTDYNYIDEKLEMPTTKNDKEVADKLYQRKQTEIERIINNANKIYINSNNYQEQFLIRMLLIILYKNENLSNDLKEKIKKLFSKDRFELIITDSSIEEKLKQIGITKREVNTCKKIAYTIFFLLLDKGYEKNDINAIVENKYGKYQLIYEANEFNNQNFTKNQKDYYDDLQVKNNKYKVLVSYYYEEMLILIDGLKNSDLQLYGIEIKNNNGFVYIKYETKC